MHEDVCIFDFNMSIRGHIIFESLLNVHQKSNVSITSIHSKYMVLEREREREREIVLSFIVIVLNLLII